jgi:chemotaxis response regulator CheB
MPELLARCTPLKVEHAKDRQPLEAEHVYIIPPNRFLTLDQGLFLLKEPVDRRALRGTIDHFFRSLAAAQQERAVGIIMSGTGTEGTLGLKAIKAEGGSRCLVRRLTSSTIGMCSYRTQGAIRHASTDTHHT